MKKNQNKNIGIFTFCLMALIGTYNAVVINSESNISGSKNFKRLDEVYGVVKTGRSIAVESNWRKVSTVVEAKKPVATASVFASVTSTSSEAVVSEAVIQDELSMKLIDVINPKKWSNGVTSNQFNGSIITNNGIIESLVASLPEDKNIDISFSEMNGNVFEYDLDGEIYSGMMYQVDQSAYMVTLTNGPLEGTRLKFSSESVNTEAQKDYLAETHNVEVQTFGADVQNPELETTEDVAVQAAEAPLYNFNI